MRTRKDCDYTTVDNTFLRDTELSAKAKGIFAYLLMLPDDWTINVSELVDHFRDGRDSIYEGIKELKERWYFIVAQERLPTGKLWQPIYTVVEKPHTEKPDTDLPFTEKPYTDKPRTAKPYTENPSLLNTNNTKYWIIPSTEYTKEDLEPLTENPETAKPEPRKAYGDPDINSVIDAIRQRHGTVDGTQAENRKFWKLLVDKITAMDWFDGDYGAFVLALIDNSDQYSIGQTTSPKKLYYNLGNVMARIRASSWTVGKAGSGVRLSSC